MNNALTPDGLTGSERVSLEQPNATAAAMQGIERQQASNATTDNEGIKLRRRRWHESYGPAWP
jgi:hypothetical protein